jgi:hypothetical protein
MAPLEATAATASSRPLSSDTGGKTIARNITVTMRMIAFARRYDAP